MQYRIADTDDIEGICILIKNAIIEMESHGIFQWDDLYPVREDFLDDIEKNTLYLATEKNDIVALYAISGEADEEYDNAKWSCPRETSYVLHRFCVSPAYQNRGIGKIILKHIEDQIKDMGYESVRLDVFTENPFAQRLYLSDGFEVRGYADWRKGRFDLMEKKL